MAEPRRDAPSPDAGHICPLLGLYNDRERRFATWHLDHRCWAGARPVPIERAYQAEVCTTSGYTTCPTYAAWAWATAGAPVTPAADVGADGGPVPAKKSAADDETPAGMVVPSDALDQDDDVRPAEPNAAGLAAGIAATGGIRSGARARAAADMPPAGPGAAETLDDLLSADLVADEEVEAVTGGGAGAEPAAAPGAPAELVTEAEPVAPSEAAGEPDAAGPTEPEQTPPPEGYRYLPGAAPVAVAAHASIPYPADAYASVATEAATEGGPTPATSEVPEAAPVAGRASRARRALRHLLRGVAILVIAVIALAGLVGVGYLAGKILVRPGTAVATPAPTLASTPAASILATPEPTIGPTPTGTIVPTATPGPSPTAAPKPTPRTYVVRSGDTLFSIAAKFGVTVAALEKLNKIKDPNLIQVGQRLKIPPP